MSSIFRCLHPRTFVNKLGREITVSCGKCVACRNAKGTRLTRYCAVEQEHHKYTYFVTLTYRPQDLPVCEPIFQDVVDEDTGEILGCQPYQLNGNYYLFNKCERLREYYPADVVCAVPSKEFPLKNYSMFVNKFNLPEQYKGMIPFLAKKDVQNFMKRLRFYIKKYYTDEKIRYFACGEYGPKHFRPHFHLLLFSNSDKLSRSLRWCVRAAWRFGRVDIQSVKGGATNYCASYLNSSSVVSRLHETSEIRPFSLHSQHFAECVFESSEKAVYQNGYHGINGMPVRTGNGIELISTPVSYERRLFPKSYAFSESTHRERATAYRLFQTALEDFGIEHIGVEKLAQLVVAYPRCHTYNIIYSLFRKYHHNDDDFEKCVYTCLLNSYLFLRQCKKFDYSFDYLLECIENYYLDKDYSNLKNQYIQQQQFLDKYGYENRQFLVNFYDNVKVDYYRKGFTHIPVGTDSHLVERFYDSIGIEPNFVEYCNSSMLLNPEYVSFVGQARRISRDKIKHKKQNDENLIFLQDG